MRRPKVSRLSQDHLGRYYLNEKTNKQLFVAIVGTKDSDEIEEIDVLARGRLDANIVVREALREDYHPSFRMLDITKG